MYILVWNKFTVPFAGGYVVRSDIWYPPLATCTSVSNTNHENLCVFSFLYCASNSAASLYFFEIECMIYFRFNTYFGIIHYTAININIFVTHSNRMCHWTLGFHFGRQRQVLFGGFYLIRWVSFFWFFVLMICLHIYVLLSYTLPSLYLVYQQGPNFPSFCLYFHS